MTLTHLRPAIQNDARAIQRLVRAARINPLGLDWRRFVVAVDPVGEVIGCGQVKLHRERAGAVVRELASIAVQPEWRGQGVASAVIHNLLASETLPIYLTCRASLGSFYERFGFRTIPEAKMPAYFRWINRLMKLFKRMRLVDEELLVMGLGD
jgi:N-acetylglutamate synthase-like GNAT family acetyltransferase